MHKLKAFTLIELLVVIAIIGILSGFIFISMSSAINSANDAKRKADIASIEKAIMVYKTLGNPLSDTGGTCELISNGSGCDIVNDPNFQAYLKNVPIDPDGSTYYTYSSDGTDFVVSGNLSTGNTYYYDSVVGSYEQPSTPPELPNLFVDWHEAWININNPGSEIADYQIQVPVYWVPGMQSDFGDIRFGNTNGTVAYSYWMESKIDGESAVFWVKVPTVSAGTSHFGIFYHNVGTVTTTSNGDNTFSFFDDFNLGSLDTNKWTGTTNGSAAFSYYPAQSYSTISLQASPGTTNNWVRMISTTGFSTNIAVRMGVKVNYFGNTTNYEFFGLVSGANGASPYVLGMFAYPGSNGGKYYNYVTADALNSIMGVTAGSYFNFDIIRNGSTSNIYRINDANEVTTTSQVPTGTLYIYSNSQGVSGGATSAVYFDWVLVRKYILNEPTYQSITYLE